MKKKVVIIGGGAAGFFCAANIHHPQIEVVLLEKTSKLLSKVKVSGGGRCNVTNASYDDILDFSSSYPRGKNLLKKTLHKFSFRDTFDWFQSRQVPLKIENDGRVFPHSNDSQSIIDCLVSQCQKNKTQIRLNTPVKRIVPHGEQYIIETHQEKILTDYVVVATGGYPKLEQYQWLENLDLKIETPQPSLFTFNLPKHPITELMGVAVTHVSVRVVGEKLKTEGPILITHWGLSGPAILKASAWGARLLAEKNWTFSIHVNWIEPQTEEALRLDFNSIKSHQGNKMLIHKNPFGLPHRLWEYLLLEIGIGIELRWSELPSKLQNKLINQLTQYEFKVQGKTTFKEEFVTAGGIALSNIHSQTLELKNWNHVFAIGEAVDVDGVTGGYNFQNAWTSGYIVAKEILKSLS